MRELHGHKVNPANDEIMLAVMDAPGEGGACYEYQVQIPGESPGVPIKHVSINFQNGPILEAGVNGITHEVLLEILTDRLQGFQNGKFDCEANELALGHIKAA